MYLCINSVQKFFMCFLKTSLTLNKEWLVVLQNLRNFIVFLDGVKLTCVCIRPYSPMKALKLTSYRTPEKKIFGHFYCSSAIQYSKSLFVSLSSEKAVFFYCRQSGENVGVWTLWGASIAWRMAMPLGGLLRWR